MAATGVTSREQIAFRRGNLDGRPLSPKEREQMLKPFLPPEPESTKGSPKAQKQKQQKRSSRLIKHTLHVLIHAVISFIFSVFFRFRRSWRHVKSKVSSYIWHHHRTPEFIQRDVKHLNKLPHHLSVVLDYHEGDDDQGDAGLEGLVKNLREVAAWTASAGIPFLSVYERTGKLKNYIQQTHSAISGELEAFFGPRRKPTLSVRAPHIRSYSPPLTPPSRATSPDPTETKDERQHLTVLLLSAEDGRDTMVDLTKTLSDMAQSGTLRPDQIDTNLIDAELREAVSTDPELLILFSPVVQLKGYPPWQLRLTEIFHVPDNKGVNYQVFLRALCNFAKAEMRVGR
ncbi:Undecaprenyl diphosphate synthase [Aaosphaeria arxii CBS 175.79]|uniref:ditrans,polycis-polyprenyl diphosphate synthase [(2E,6E)-farnesyldiphosphate specific] n=1 Tax=Aaosphaeria arxii CBS 175.79 TaxID=1450172 RepID=A0A6A5XK77_9PLEO|nr:Undecaprenyl diphosphate synthase [Aaosphaeria arxii CBS 175.79]KAF2013279.1 Undecaprenyl diphosphate synthase [Aaosphaeria arxii CBS 175.79]